jgi:D-sedoheptulose 7-phosphate isomerase
MKTPAELLHAEIEEHRHALDQLWPAVQAPFAKLLEASIKAIAAGNKILLFGNGGSAADAQHIATELTVRYRRSRPALTALSLTTDTSTLTAIGNDLGFEHLFARQVEALARPGDIAIGITTSGNSPNVINGLLAAGRRQCVTTCLTGNDGGKIRTLCAIPLVVPSSSTARIQEMHILLGHALCEGLEAASMDQGDALPKIG